MRLGRKSLVVVWIKGALLTVGCHGAAGSATPDAADDRNFPAQLYSTVVGDQGLVQTSVWTAPDQPPIRGNITVKLLIDDAVTHAPVDGLTLEIVPTMPAMGHGTSVVPQVTPQGAGVYIATDVTIFMAGQWNLDIGMTGTVTDHVTIPFDVQ